MLTDIFVVRLLVLMESHLILMMNLKWVLLKYSLVFQMMEKLRVHLYMNHLYKMLEIYSIHMRFT